jgi:type I restriction enzyme S subunit
MISFFGSPSWSPGKLRDLVLLQRGFDITKAEQKDGEVPVISSSGPGSHHNVPKVRGPGVVIGRKGTLGTVFYSEGDYWPHDTTLWSMDLNGNNPRFVYYALQRIDMSLFDTGAANPTLNRNHIHGLPIFVPDRAIQDRIAAVLASYDDLIEANRRRITLLEDAARQLYKEWFVRFRFPGHEHVAMIDGVPEGWERAPASSVLNVLSGGTPTTTTPQFWDGGIGFFTPKDAVRGAYVFGTEKMITEEGLAKCNSKLYPKDTLFITARGTVGKMNLALAPMAMNQSCYALISKSCISQRMLYLTMDASLQQFRSQASGAVFDAIVVATFDRISVIKPAAKTAEAFDDLINPAFDQIANLGRQNEQLARARDLLLPKLMNGTLTV